MKLEIFSLNAAVAGWSEGTVWSGEVDDSYFIDCGPTVEDTLERIWRLFNVVEHDDRPRLLSWGYRLPSMSIGDFVTIPDPDDETATKTYEAVSIGFRLVDRDDLLKPYMPPRR